MSYEDPSKPMTYQHTSITYKYNTYTTNLVFLHFITAQIHYTLLGTWTRTTQLDSIGACTGTGATRLYYIIHYTIVTKLQLSL
jgi:hypothetical protein